MKKVLILGVLVFLFIVTGCAATSSGPLPFGKDTYMITSSASTLGDFGHPLTIAIKEANAYCIKKGQVFVPENTSYVPMAFGRPEHSQLIFRCVDKNDVENQRPNWRKTPDTVIENSK